MKKCLLHVLHVLHGQYFRSRLLSQNQLLHPEKTRLIEFGRYASKQRQARGEGKPETFNFLGFKHKTKLDWQRMYSIINRWIPTPHITHPYPEQGFGVTT